MGPVDRNESGGGVQKAVQLHARSLPWLVAVLLKERLWREDQKPTVGLSRIPVATAPLRGRRYKRGWVDLELSR